MKNSLTLLLLTLALQANASINSVVAEKLFYSVKEALSKKISERDIEIRYKIDSNKEIPGAFSKWIKTDKVASIKVTGGLLKMKSINEKVFVAYLCHEFGHFLGGTPYVKGKESIGIHSFRNRYKFMSVEGQADYFAANSCLLPVFIKMGWKTNELKQEHLFECNQNESTQECYSVLNTISEIMDSYSEVLKHHFNIDSSFNTLERSSVQVVETLNKAGQYPNLQCRFDTMIAGISNDVRPSCWFNE